MKERTSPHKGDTRPFFLVPTTSKRLLRRLTDSSPGAPNDGMFPRVRDKSNLKIGHENYPKTVRFFFDRDLSTGHVTSFSM